MLRYTHIACLVSHPRRRVWLQKRGSFPKVIDSCFPEGKAAGSRCWWFISIKWRVWEMHGVFSPSALTSFFVSALSNEYRMLTCTWSTGFWRGFLFSFAPKVIFFCLLPAYYLHTVHRLTLFFVLSCVLFCFYVRVFPFATAVVWTAHRIRYRKSSVLLLSGTLHVTVRTFPMIHYSLVYICFVCDCETVRRGRRSLMEWRTKWNTFSCHS